MANKVGSPNYIIALVCERSIQVLQVFLTGDPLNTTPAQILVLHRDSHPAPVLGQGEVVHRCALLRVAQAVVVRGVAGPAIIFLFLFFYLKKYLIVGPFPPFCN
jgi:hypothetical protein